MEIIDIKNSNSWSTVIGIVDIKNYNYCDAALLRVRGISPVGEEKVYGDTYSSENQAFKDW